MNTVGYLAPLEKHEDRCKLQVNTYQGECFMHTLYDSDTFSVTHMLANAPHADVGTDGAGNPEQAVKLLPMMARHGFEIIDKRAGKEVYLDGSWAELFQQKIAAWQVKTPTQEEVEDTLDGYAGLAQNPVVVH